MKPISSIVHVGLASAFSLNFLGTCILAQSTNTAGPNKTATAPSVIGPGDNLKTDGLPEVPSELADSVRLYTEARGASMFSWHPNERGILISTRFANSNQVHRVSMPGGARYQLTFFNEPVGSAAYPPNDDSYFLYTRDVGGNEFAQLYRFDLDTGKSTLLSDGGRSQNGGWVWDRSKSMICYASTRRNGADRDIWGLNPKDPTSNRILFELKGGGWSAQDWSENNVHVLIRETLSINKSNLYLGEIAHGRLRPITPQDDEVSYGEAAFSADGRTIYVTTDRGSEFQQLSKMDLETGKLDSITSDIPWDVENWGLSEDRKQIAFIVNRAGISDLYVYDTATGMRRRVEKLPTGVISLGAWRNDNSEFAITITSAQSSSDVYSIRADSLEVTRWTESEMGGLKPESLAVPKLIEWKSFDNTSISGFLYEPPSSFAGPRPVIINIHGGPEGQSRPNFLGRSNYFINELGCAIIYPNVRGSVGYGKSFTKLDNGFKRLDSVKDIGALLEWIANDSRFDKNRIMITGGSYGGYMTLACAVEYDAKIACSLDVVGISHFGTFLKNTESYRRDLRRVEYGDERNPDMAAFFEKMAPLNNAQKITKPLFVVQGGNDPRVPLSEADQIVAKVKVNKGPVWYLMATDEGHGFRKKNNADYQFYATILFIKKHLLGAP
ncbi:MAG: S9 family peptidase [Planctomycetes bacterium]|nr:S9 family peptidase [Planctomycetota bacterium]